MTAFTSYLLDDRHNIRDQEAGRVIGNLGTTSDIFAVITGLFLGSLMDLVGRKLPSVAGLLISGTGTLLNPVPSNLLGLYFCRVMVNIGALPFLWSPYQVDYIKPQSLGLLSSYMTVVAHLCTINASVVAVQIEIWFGCVYVYALYGSIVLIIACILCFGI